MCADSLPDNSTIALEFAERGIAIIPVELRRLPRVRVNRRKEM
jgi:hypothetical protein